MRYFLIKPIIYVINITNQIIYFFIIINYEFIISFIIILFQNVMIAIISYLNIYSITILYS